MKISMIAAMAENRVIGKNNQMPWHLPADLKHFKSVTLGKPVIMGRKTYESIGKALPGRQNIVVTTNLSYKLADATVVHDCESALKVAELGESQEVMVIGGGTIYEAFMDRAEQLFLTFIHLSIDGDTQFPDYEQSGTWVRTEQEMHQSNDKNAHSYEFVTLVRNR